MVAANRLVPETIAVHNIDTMREHENSSKGKPFQFQFDSIDWINAFGLDSMHSAKFMRHRNQCKGTHSGCVSDGRAESIGIC